MQNNRSSKFSLGLTFFFWVMFFSTFGQGNPDKQIQTVFDQLVLAYGNAKTSPQLIVISDKPKQIPPAKYYPDPKPTIEVDAYLVTICRTFGKDSLNALSVVLSHELAHYYSDHTFCSDYAYVLKDQSKSLAEKLKGVSKGEMISKETEADQKGFFYAAAAGFLPFDVQSKLLDTIYTQYNYPDNLPGYPTKQERKGISQTAEAKAKQLYGTFMDGIKAMQDENYDKAISNFEEANSYIPFRENFNNLGVARARMALEIKDMAYIEKEHPNRFLYPLEIDNTSRLKKEDERGTDYEKQERVDSILKLARKDFQEAIRLDPGYTIAYINLACVFDLLGNPDAAIGTIKQLPMNEQKNKEAQRLLAIAYYHAGMELKAEEIWSELKL